jgi:hypothetical protein
MNHTTILLFAILSACVAILWEIRAMRVKRFAIDGFDNLRIVAATVLAAGAIICAIAMLA